MTNSFFYHKRKTRMQALWMLCIAAGAPFSMWFMLNVVAGGQVPAETEQWIYLGTLLVSVVLVFIFVIPDFRRNAIFEFEVTDQYVRCDCPAGDKYLIPLGDIVRLKQVKKITGNDWVDELIETKDGQLYSIPKRYNLHVGKAVDAIRQADPTIERTNEVSY